MLCMPKTGTKVVDGLAPVILLTVAVAGAGMITAQLVATRLDDVAQDKFPSALHLAGIVQAEARVARGINALLLPQMTDAATRSSIYAEMQKQREGILASMKAYEAVPRSDAALRLWGNVRERHQAWDAATQRAIALLHERDGRAAQGGSVAQRAAFDRRMWAAYLAARQEFTPLGEAVQAVVDVTKSDVETGRRAARKAELASEICLVATMAIGFVLMLGLGRLLATSLASAARRAKGALGAAAAERKARGSLRRRADGVYEIARPISHGLRNLAIAAGLAIAFGWLAWAYAGRTTAAHLAGVAIPFVAIALLELAMDGRRNGRRASGDARVLQLH